MKDIVYEYRLDIKHYDRDQTVEEIHKPCEACLFRKDELCLIFNSSVKLSIHSCVSNYRIDIETLVSAMQEKLKVDGDTWFKWLNSIQKYPKDITDIVGVHKDLEKVLGE